MENEENSLGEIDAGEQLVADAFGESVGVTPFLNRRLSFLSKSQGVALKVGNNTLNETFSLAQFILEGYLQPRRQYAQGKIITLN